MDIELINKYLKSQPFEVKSFLLHDFGRWKFEEVNCKQD